MAKHTNGATKLQSIHGEAIIKLLNLTSGEYDRVATSVGTKNALGLALTIERIITDTEFARDIARGVA